MPAVLTEPPRETLATFVGLGMKSDNIKIYKCISGINSKPNTKQMEHTKPAKLSLKHHPHLSFTFSTSADVYGLVGDVGCEMKLACFYHHTVPSGLEM